LSKENQQLNCDSTFDMYTRERFLSN
jgi:hypothetical protein